MPDTETTDPEVRREEPAPAPAPEPAEPDWATSYKYLLAEFDNFRKRTEREREQRSRDARGLLLRELLPLHDALASARDSHRSLPEHDPIRRGFELLQREWDRFLTRQGVEAIARVGEMFHADRMEAVGEAPASSEHPEGTIVELTQQGYAVGGAVLRPARVIVARAEAPPSPATDESKPPPKGGNESAASDGTS